MSKSYLHPSSLILVAILPGPEDLQYARVLGWYRIPVRSAPRVLSVDFLAFYQPASFHRRKWRVEYLAPVRGHELTTRNALLQDQPDHPRADEEYFKLQLGPLEKLPQPILAGSWKRFTFFYTTGEYLREAETLTDLTVQPSQRRQLWKTLRERQNAWSGRLDEEPKDRLPEEVIAALLGIEQEKDAEGELSSW